MAEIYGINFADPQKIREKQNALLQEQLAQSQQGNRGAGAVGGGAFGAGISKLMHKFSGPSAEEQAAVKDQEILGQTMNQLGMSVKDARNSAGLPAERSADFSQKLSENMMKGGNYEKAAQLMQKSEEQRAKALAQKQLIMSTDVMEKAEKDRQRARDLADQHILVEIDDDGRPTVYQDDLAFDGESILTGGSTAQGIKNIGDGIAEIKQRTGKNVLSMPQSQFNEEVLGFGGTAGMKYSVKEAGAARETYQVHSETLDTVIPLLDQLAADSGALQGTQIDPMTGGFHGGVAGIWAPLQSWGQSMERVAKGAGLGDVFTNPDGSTTTFAKYFGAQDVDALGISSGAAQAKIIGIAYAIAKARDPGGRLSDQDVNLAMRSLTGTGGTREIAEQFGLALRSANTSIKAVDDRFSETNVIPAKQRKSYHEQATRYQGAIDRLHAAADERNIPYIPGSKRWQKSMDAGHNGNVAPQTPVKQVLSPAQASGAAPLPIRRLTRPKG